MITTETLTASEECQRATVAAETAIDSMHGMGGHTAAMQCGATAVSNADYAIESARLAGDDFADTLAPFVARAEAARVAGQREVDWYYGPNRP